MLDFTLETLNEDGHTDVASMKNKVQIAMSALQKMQTELSKLGDEADLPTWWTNKVATAVSRIDDMADYLDVKVEGLKTKLIRDVKAQAEGELNRTDWYITRKAEKNTAIPSAITTHRDAVRSKQAAMETAITNASDIPALETLYTYTLQEDGTTTRPLGEIPNLD